MACGKVLVTTRGSFDILVHIGSWLNVECPGGHIKGVKIDMSTVHYTNNNEAQFLKIPYYCLTYSRNKHIPPPTVRDDVE